MKVKWTLTARLAIWIALTYAVTMAFCAAVVYVVVLLEERGEGPREAIETPEEMAEDQSETVAVALAIAAPFGLLLSVGGAVWIARRTVAPVRAVIRAATEIGAASLQRRLPVAGGDDELAELVVTLNKLLERLEAGFQAESAFAAHASHELRTPLAVLAADLEVALQRPRTAEEWTETAGRALAEVGQLSRLVDGLLQLRRAQIVAPGIEDGADLGVVIEDVAARAAGPAGAAGVGLHWPSPLPADQVRGRAEELALALGNVVNNAVRASPAGRSVQLLVVPDGATIALHVDDQGPGVAPGDEARIFEPFKRGTGAAPDGGVGLGLAIARRILDNAGGSLRHAPRSEGGSRFTLIFQRR